VASLLIGVAPAAATFHLMKIREVYPAGNASYVVLQTLDIGESQLAGHRLITYNANGTIADNFNFPNNIKADAPNNTTVLVAGSGFAAAFPGKEVDEPNPAMSLSPGGGAICWIDGEPPDCVAWGNFTGPLPANTPPLVTGNPASPGGVTAGKALRRSIALSCATILEEADDRDDSSLDFSEQTPGPRNSKDAVTESDCQTPTATIDSKPTNPTKDTFAKFFFRSTPPGASFECKLDTALFVPCLRPEDDPYEYTGLPDGSHTFQVRASNSQGTGISAVYTWLVDTQAPSVTIKSSPANPSPGASATFTYEASQLGSSFECSVDTQGQADIFTPCAPTGQTYANLPEGNHTFKVRATDKAGNQGQPAVYGWRVDNSATTAPPAQPPASLVTIPPPLTTIPKPPAKPAPLKCKKGFVKKKVKGKTRCVKKPKPKKKKR
jgi:hypothetical protein